MNLTQIKQTIRLLLKNRLYSVVNIAGLSISISLVVLLMVYISKEKNVDGFHENKDNIYRVVRNNECAFSPPFGQYIADNIDGVKSFCRTFVLEATLKSEYNLLQSPDCYYVDSNFFEMFSFPLIAGEAGKVLNARNNVVISESFAKQLFPAENPIGRVILFNNRLEYIVSGIAKDFTENTHFKQADVIFPFQAMNDFFGNQEYLVQYDWHYFLAGLYVRAEENVDLSNKGDEIYNKAKPWYWLFQEDGSKNIAFQPLTDIYFQPAVYNYATGAREGNSQLLKLLSFIVIGILIIASINFINLTISYSVKRHNEIGIKKIVGAFKNQIIYQSLLETSLFFFISMLLSVGLIIVALPAFNQLVNYNIDVSGLFANIKWHVVLLIILTSYTIAGIIPAIVLAGFTPLSFAEKLYNKIRITTAQHALVVIQYTISIVLIVAMLSIIKQNKFLRNYNVGFNKEETLFIKLNSDIKNHKLSFKEELKKISGVENVSLCNSMPGVGIISLRFTGENNTQYFDLFHIDEDYFKVMDIAVQNNGFLNENNCWINESAARSPAYNSIRKTIEIDEYGTQKTLLVKEILPDMNFHSLYENTRPTIFTKVNTDAWVDYALCRVNTSNLGKILSDAEVSFKTFSSNFPFNYTFLDDEINKAYLRETRTSKIVMWFSIFAILISSLGIFALAVFASNKRIKEIGIRKVNGAKIAEIITMLNLGFIKWILISFMFATPIAWFAMEKWLENFAYKTNLNWWIFALAGIMALGIAMLTIGWHSWRAAGRNPVEALRYE